MTGKGSIPRPFSVTNEEYKNRWAAIFGKDLKEIEDQKNEDEAFEQIANQTFIVATMSFVPGFESYGLTKIPDAQFYRSRELYPTQQTVDNQRLLRGLTGASDQRHADMVDSQYVR